MNHMYKYRILTAAVLLAMSTATLPAHAAIPVIDTSNIAEQAKTYAETIKVVTNTKAQIELMTQELKKLPSSILSSYKTAFSEGISRVASILQQNGGVIYTSTGIAGGQYAGISTAEINKQMTLRFPGIIGNDLPASMTAERTARSVAISSIMENNANTLAAYSSLVNELNGCMRDLKDLQELSHNATGNMQAQQIANDIQMVTNHMNNINTAILALKGQQSAMQSQAEAQEKQNQIAVEDARATAESNICKTWWKNSKFNNGY